MYEYINIFSGTNRTERVSVNIQTLESNSDNIVWETIGRVVDLFFKAVHTTGTWVFFITQQLFHQARGQRGISLTHTILFSLRTPQTVLVRCIRTTQGSVKKLTWTPQSHHTDIYYWTWNSPHRINYGWVRLCFQTIYITCTSRLVKTFNNAKPLIWL